MICGQLLATGLSGLYSSLPRQLDYPSDDWNHLSADDVAACPALSMFLNSLEFCNAVVQVRKAHPNNDSFTDNKLCDCRGLGLYHQFNAYISYIINLMCPDLHREGQYEMMDSICPPVCLSVYFVDYSWLPLSLAKHFPYYLVGLVLYLVDWPTIVLQCLTLLVGSSDP